MNHKHLHTIWLTTLKSNYDITVLLMKLKRGFFFYLLQ